MKDNCKVILEKYPSRERQFLIPILQEIQAQDKYLSKEALIIVGEHLKIPVSKVYGVATFYNQFKFKAPGLYHIQLCRGTACHVKGSFNILQTLQEFLKIKPGETTKDGLFSLEIVACVGACSLAPVIVVNDEFYARIDNKKLKNLIEDFRKEATRHEK